MFSVYNILCWKVSRCLLLTPRLKKLTLIDKFWSVGGNSIVTLFWERGESKWTDECSPPSPWLLNALACIYLNSFIHVSLTVEAGEQGRERVQEGFYKQSLTISFGGKGKNRWQREKQHKPNVPVLLVQGWKHLDCPKVAAAYYSTKIHTLTNVKLPNFFFQFRDSPKFSHKSYE